MVRRETKVLIGLLWCMAFAWNGQAGDNRWMIAVRTDAEDSLYQVGETATFTVRQTDPDRDLSEGTFRYELSNDGWKTLEEGRLTMEDGMGTVNGALDGPGFLRCTVKYLVNGEVVSSTMAAAGFEPLKIEPSMDAPDDFDAFWDEKKDQLADIPLNSKMLPVVSPSMDIQCFDIKVQCLGGKPVSGYYARPSRLDPATGQVLDIKFPAVLFVQGAGVRSARRETAAQAAAMGMIALDINAHGLENGHPDSYYEELARNGLKGYPHFGKDKREESYFLGMFLRVIRALDFLASQPEWDGQYMVVRGSSQGGAQAIAAAGLDPRVTHITAGVAAMCDHTARINGWPRFVDMNSEETPDERVLNTARYFDMTNFARRATADAIFSVGFIDNTCRPTGVYAAYNVYGGRKEMLNGTLMVHEIPVWVSEAFADWMKFRLFD